MRGRVAGSVGPRKDSGRFYVREQGFLKVQG
jgi:hypothetical protein